MAPPRPQVATVLRQYGLVPDQGVISILVVLTLVWITWRVGGEAVGAFFEQLVARPIEAIGPKPWQIFTASFMAARATVVLSATVTLLFFGNAVEAQLGAGGVWKVFIVGGTLGMFGGSLVGRLLSPDCPLLGPDDAGAAMLTAYAATMRNQNVLLFGGVRAPTMAWIWLTISSIFILASVEDYGPRVVAIHLAALASAAAAGWFVVDFKPFFKRGKPRPPKRKYQVLQGGRDGDGKRWLN